MHERRTLPLVFEGALVDVRQTNSRIVINWLFGAILHFLQDSATSFLGREGRRLVRFCASSQKRPIRPKEIILISLHGGWVVTLVQIWGLRRHPIFLAIITVFYLLYNAVRHVFNFVLVLLKRQNLRIAATVLVVCWSLTQVDVLGRLVFTGFQIFLLIKINRVRLQV